ncbi:MAG TPA: sulfite dehydrogenase [Thermoanaerobaculia bacterium]|nr:sulfite dehydrogenase [Thermoanaerobaculia bacterium]
MKSDRRTLLAASLAAIAAAACEKTARVAAEPGARALGDGRRAYGERSPFERAERAFRQSNTPATSSSRTPLQDTYGIVTPSSLHFERHHSGVPRIDPSQHQLLIHGLVDRPVSFRLDDLHRFRSVSRIHFVECAGNSGREQAGRPGEDPQKSHGLASCSEWTGVPLSVVLQEAGLKPTASWVVAEGADASRHSRSIPIAKALDDVIVAYGQNGEAVRPEQGYPLRLLVPGWEGNMNVKWLHRLEVADEPAMSKDEAASYTDLMPAGKAWRFSFVLDAKSVVTRPAGGQRLPGPGLHEIQGLAWSGRGRISRVDVSTDDERSWQQATLQDPVLPKAFTRFRLPWTWSGAATTLRSRCADETGYVQPTREEIVAVRGLHEGPDGFDHYNGMKIWRVEADGRVTHV